MPPELKKTEETSHRTLATSLAPNILHHIENNIDVRQHSPEVLRLMAQSLANRLQDETDAMLQSLKEGTRAKQMMQEIAATYGISQDASAQIGERGAFGAWTHPQDTASGSETRPFYETATPEEWLAAFTEWTESHRDLPRVPASAFSREADYEDRL